MNEIAILFKSARLKKKLSQKQVSDLAGVSQGTISKYETGRQMPRVAELFRLVKALKIPIKKIARLEDVFFKSTFKP